MKMYTIRWLLCRSDWRCNEFCCYNECRYKEGSLYIPLEKWRDGKSGEPGLVDRVLALHAGSRGFDSHRGHMSERFFRSNRPGYPHPVSSELEISGIRVAVGDCSVTERRRWRPPYQTGKTVRVHANTRYTTRTDARRRVCAAMVPYRWATRGTSLRELEYTHTRREMDGRTAPRTAAMDTFRWGTGGTSLGEWENNNNNETGTAGMMVVVSNVHFTIEK